jgi:DNA integrity scanning protein DisA with diadenylate cyclase activity
MNEWVICFLIAFGFLLRGLFAPAFWVRILFFLLSLASVLAGLPFFKERISPEIVTGVGLIFMLASAAFLTLDFFINFYRIVRNFFQTKFSLMPSFPKYLKEITRALQLLAARRTGALIILEGKDSLDSYVDLRTKFDAEVRAELLSSIFHTASPLHDGGLLIHKGRIKAARVVFPVSTQTPVPVEMGTRHRSAISITERTDAIALVASEERGTLSVVYRGMLVVSKSPEHFAHLLSNALKGKPIGSFTTTSPLHTLSPVKAQL